jgi:hypothetical protein
MSNQWKDVKDQFTIEDIGAPLLANLAKGIYTPEAMLREYVQNAGDAYFELEDKTHKKHRSEEKAIDIYYADERTIAIQDDGIGMDLEDVKHYKRIALSSKIGKDRAGFRGIGIWAGFSACDELYVETSKINDPHRYRLTLNFAEMRNSVSQNINIKELLDKRFKIQKSDASKAEHYTQVRLVNLNEEFADLLKPEELERIVSEILPCRFNPEFKHADTISKRLMQIDGYQEFAIKVNQTEIFKKYPQNVEEPQFDILKNDDEEYGFVWYCRSPSTSSFGTTPSNFRLRVKNIAVGSPGMYSAEDARHWGVSGAQSVLASGELLDWYFGEIHITHSDVRPNTPRSELELDSLSRKAIGEIRRFYAERIAFRRANSNVNSHRSQILEVTKAIESKETYDPQSALKRLKGLKKYESLSKSRSQGKDAANQDKTQKYERVILRTLEAKETELSQKRQKAIEFLEGIAATSGTRTNRKKAGSDGGQELRKNGGTAKQKMEETLDLFSTGTATSRSDDFDQLLAEICQVLEKRLQDQDELCSDLCESIEDIFKEHGLLVTA